MLGLIGKLAPLITGMTTGEDGAPQKVSGEFSWLVRLPLMLGVLLVLVGLFAPVPEDKKDEVYEIGLALVVGGPVAYGARKRMTKGQALPPAPVTPAAPPSPVEAPKSDGDAASQIEKL